MMEDTTGFQGKPTQDVNTLAGGVRQRNAQISRDVAITLWVMGVIILLVASAIILFVHPGPWPFDLQTTVTLQSLQYWPWLLASIDFPSRFNDIIPATIAFALWLAGLLLTGWIFKRRGKSPMLWIVTALFIVFGTLFADLAINGLISRIVNRPRPSPLLIHVYNPETVPSFPSGHVEHTVVYYGFLLYLSFTKPVREWRYHWLLLPLQIFAALNILMIGYSRVEEGSHWLTDALAGYLEGAVALLLLIFVYRWTLKKLEERRAMRLVEQPAMATQAHQPGGEIMLAKTLESVQVVDKKMKPYEELFIKCKDDWIHHLAQALAFSLLLALVPIAMILLSIYGSILGKLDLQVQTLVTRNFETIIPAPLSAQTLQLFSQAFSIFLHAPGIAIVFTFLSYLDHSSFL
jgi:membrane-associated phospholipid phosphatase